MNFAAVVAHDKNRLIGGDNKLLWHLPEDLKNFKKLTLNSTVIMGRKTFESIGKPLPKRLNVVLTKDKDFRPEHCLIYDRVEDVIRDFAEDPQVFIIGGGEIYKQFFPFIQRIYVSLVDGEYQGDTYFPEYGPEQGWKCFYDEQKEGFKLQTWIKK
jgi:dihydrofolate reductase